MSTVSDNDDAPQPNHALVASLLPTIRPPKALETPDGHTKRSTAQLVIGKTLSLCLMAGILGAGNGSSQPAGPCPASRPLFTPIGLTAKTYQCCAKRR